MPYLEQQLPWQGLTPQSRQASRSGAANAAPRALNQTVRYLQALKDRPQHGLTDAEAAVVLGVERTSINARRVPLVKAGLVYASSETRLGRTGVKNVVWKISR